MSDPARERRKLLLLSERWDNAAPADDGDLTAEEAEAERERAVELVVSEREIERGRR